MSEESGRKNVDRVLPGERTICVKYMFFSRQERKKITLKPEEYDTEIDFVLIGKELLRFVRNVMAVP